VALDSETPKQRADYLLALAAQEPKLENDLVEGAPHRRVDPIEHVVTEPLPEPTKAARVVSQPVSLGRGSIKRSVSIPKPDWKT